MICPDCRIREAVCEYTANTLKGEFRIDYCPSHESRDPVQTAEPKLDHKLVQGAIQRLINASFKCGEWDRNESDEPYDTILARSNKAEADLWKMLTPYLGGD